MTVKERIQINFSRHARNYDKYARVQKRTAEMLVEKCDVREFKDILDIGCGTGTYTILLKKCFPDARITAVDISKEMIDVAEKKLQDDQIQFITKDAERLEFNRKFDLITSNASLQWFEKFEEALSLYKELLLSGGVISFSIFGPRTFYELNEVVSKLSNGKRFIQASSFIEGQKIGRIMEDHFNNVEIEEETIVERYCSLIELLNTIKYTGTRGGGALEHLWTPGIIRRLEEIYRSEYSDIIATYQIFFCKGLNAH